MELVNVSPGTWQLQAADGAVTYPASYADTMRAYMYGSAVWVYPDVCDDTRDDVVYASTRPDALWLARWWVNLGAFVAPLMIVALLVVAL